MDTDKIQAELVRASDFSLQGNEAAARAIYEDLAAKGSWYAEIQLGYIYLVGKGISKDITKAEKLFRSSSQKGSQLAKYYLGLCYQETDRLQLAFVVMQELAQEGYLPAINRLGWLYENGEGCDLNLSAAVHYRKYAAQHGHLYASRWVGIWLMRGKEGISNIPRGLYLFTLTTFKIFWVTLRTPTDVRVQA
jgi:TPR repeat protein